MGFVLAQSVFPRGEWLHIVLVCALAFALLAVAHGGCLHGRSDGSWATAIMTAWTLGSLSMMRVAPGVP